MIKDYALMGRDELVSELVAVRSAIRFEYSQADRVPVADFAPWMARRTALEMRAGVIALAIFDLSESS
jgi:hypothetical protein